METSKIYRAASAQLSGVTVTLIFFFGTVSVQPRAGRIAGIFAEAQVPYETRPKPNRSNGRDKSASNSPLIISYRSIINFHIYIGLLGNIRLPRLAAY